MCLFTVFAGDNPNPAPEYRAGIRPADVLLSWAMLDVVTVLCPGQEREST